VKSLVLFDIDARAETFAGLRGIWLNRRGCAVPPGLETIGSLAELPVALREDGPP
jgi:hypothetical protein